YRCARWPYVFAALDEAVGADPRERRSAGVFGALQHGGRGAKVWDGVGEPEPEKSYRGSTRMNADRAKDQKLETRRTQRNTKVIIISSRLFRTPLWSFVTFVVKGSIRVHPR